MMPQDSPAMPMQGGAAQAFRILLVDDDHELVETLRSFLEEMPGTFEVIAAYSGDEAFLKLVEFKPDVIVLDLNLPDINGIEILNPIQDIHPSAYIVILTGNPDPAKRELALRQGAVRFLEKPLEMLGFRHLLQELGAKSRAREGSNLEGGMDILDLVQMMYLCHKTTAVRFVYGRHRGTLRFEYGEAVYIDDGSLSGEKAFYNMVLLWGEGRFYTLADEATQVLERNNWTPTDRMLMEAALLRDHAESQGASREPKSEPLQLSAEDLPLPNFADVAETSSPEESGASTQSLPDHTLSEEEMKAHIKASLGELMEVEGARAAVLVDGNGYVIEGRVRGRTLVMDKVAAVLSANLGSTQAIGRELRVGTGHLVMLEFEKGTLLARVLGARGIVALLVDSSANLGHHRCQLLKVAPEIEAVM